MANIVQAANNNKQLLVYFSTFPRHLILQVIACSWIQRLIMDLDELSWIGSKIILIIENKLLNITVTCLQQKQINSGMPQESISGSLGFIIYVSDILNSVPDLSFILDADDTSAFTSHKNIHTLNNTIPQIKVYLN